MPRDWHDVFIVDGGAPAADAAPAPAAEEERQRTRRRGVRELDLAVTPR